MSVEPTGLELHVGMGPNVPCVQGNVPCARGNVPRACENQSAKAKVLICNRLCCKRTKD